MRRGRESISRWTSALADLALPVSCPGCGAPSLALCPGCRSALTPEPRTVDPPLWSPGAPAWTGADYCLVASRCVVAWKDRGRLDLTAVLAACLATVIAAALPVAERAAPVLLVPLPSAAAATRRRGADVVALLVRAAADLCRANAPPAGAGGGAGVGAGVHVRVVPALALRRGVMDQAGLSATARGTNLAGRVRPAWGATPLVRERRVLLVDDVVTTGASAEASRRALQDAGATVCGLATVFATPRRGGRDVS